MCFDHKITPLTIKLRKARRDQAEQDELTIMVRRQEDKRKADLRQRRRNNFRKGR